MLKNEDIICISSIDWDFIWQGHQEIMTRFARNGNRVLFVENTGVRMPALRDMGRIRSRIRNWRKGFRGIRKIENGLYVYSPIVLPFPYLRIARFINKKLIFAVLLKWLKAVGFKEPVVWAFLPTGLSLDLIEEIEPKALIYYCIDSFESSSKGARKIKNTERAMLARSDLVFATSHELINHCSKHNKNVHYFPFGVNIDNFTAILNKPQQAPCDIKDIKKPIVGYLGGIHKWIDVGLVKHIAQNNPGLSFVFCGPIQMDISELKTFPNVHFLGQKETCELPAYVKEFDVALIPYRITDYTVNVYPTKLNEYLSLGKVVVSTNLPEVVNFNKANGGIVKIAGTREEFDTLVKGAISLPPDSGRKGLAIAAAKKNSWSDRIEEMSALIEQEIKKKASEREKSWKENIAKIYKKTKKKLAPAIAAVAVIYGILFHTPLLWVLASPLKVSDVPHRSDAIVALGGGVGESGRVGQGYEERVSMAAKLYKAGLADTVLFSSGYKYIMKEAQVMKVLSVASGVPEKDIMLDDSSVNTYGMIVSLKNNIISRGWRSVVLISSPYHMLRLKLLCDKELKGTKVYLVPVEKSSFYDHGPGANFGQFNGIIREYLAILYYKLKGHI